MNGLSLSVDVGRNDDEDAYASPKKGGSKTPKMKRSATPGRKVKSPKRTPRVRRRNVVHSPTATDEGEAGERYRSRIRSLKDQVSELQQKYIDILLNTTDAKGVTYQRRQVLAWTVVEVGVWLAHIDLQGYTAAFREFEVDGSILVNEIDDTVLANDIGMAQRDISTIMGKLRELRATGSLHVNCTPGVLSAAHIGSQWQKRIDEMRATHDQQTDNLRRDYEQQLASGGQNQGSSLELERARREVDRKDTEIRHLREELSKQEQMLAKRDAELHQRGLDMESLNRQLREQKQKVTEHERGARHENDADSLRRLQQLAANASRIKKEFAEESRRMASDREMMEIKIRTLELNKTAVGAIHKDLAQMTDMLRLKEGELLDMRREKEMLEEKVDRLQSELRVARKLREEAESLSGGKDPPPTSHLAVLIVKLKAAQQAGLWDECRRTEALINDLKFGGPGPQMISAQRATALEAENKELTHENQIQKKKLLQLQLVVDEISRMDITMMKANLGSEVSKMVEDERIAQKRTQPPRAVTPPSQPPAQRQPPQPAPVLQAPMAQFGRSMFSNQQGMGFGQPPMFQQLHHPAGVLQSPQRQHLQNQAAFGATAHMGMNPLAGFQNHSAATAMAHAHVPMRANPINPPNMAAPNVQIAPRAQPSQFGVRGPAVGTGGVPNKNIGRNHQRRPSHFNQRSFMSILKNSAAGGIVPGPQPTPQPPPPMAMPAAFAAGSPGRMMNPQNAQIPHPQTQMMRMQYNPLLGMHQTPFHMAPYIQMGVAG